MITGAKVQFGPEYFGFLSKEEYEEQRPEKVVVVTEEFVKIKDVKDLIDAQYEERLEQIEDSIKAMSSITVSEPIKLLLSGQELEKNEADKTYYYDNKCEIGDVRAGIVDEDKYVQAGICACLSSSPKDNTGHGWYCLD